MFRLRWSLQVRMHNSNSRSRHNPWAAVFVFSFWFCCSSPKFKIVWSVRYSGERSRSKLLGKEGKHYLQPEEGCLTSWDRFMIPIVWKLAVQQYFCRLVYNLLLPSRTQSTTRTNLTHLNLYSWVWTPWRSGYGFGVLSVSFRDYKRSSETCSQHN